MFNALKQDAAAHGFENVTTLKLIHLVLFHPSLRMLCSYRLQQLVGDSNPVARFMRRVLWMGVCTKTGCHISFDAVIEPGVRFPHATGIVIGNGAIVRSGAVIFQNVTLGVASLQDNQDFPVIENGAVIYAGAVIAGKVTVGHGAQVGANSVVRRDVKAMQIVTGNPARPVKSPSPAYKL